MNRLIFAVMIAGLLLAGPAAAQLSGALTIDNTIPTGGGNYADFVAAAADLAFQGISASVTFTVANTGVPYSGFSIVSPIVGAGPGSTVTFLGVGLPIISGPAAGYVQTIHIGTNSASATGGPTDLIFDGFEITGSPSGAGFVSGGSARITVQNCVVHTCGSGIHLVNTTDSFVQDCEVYGVGNTVGTPGSSTYSGGITCYYNAHNNTIQRNKVHDCTGNGIFVGSSAASTAPLNQTVINNFVWNTPGLGSYPGGIAIRRITGVVNNNSVSMPAGTGFGGINQMTGGTGNPQPSEIVNNIIRHDGTGGCFRFESSTVVPATYFDNNVYEAGPTAGIGAVASTLYTTLASWQALAAPNLAGLELNTLAAPTGFVSATDLHITAGSAAFNSGTAAPPGAAALALGMDIDLEARVQGGTIDRGADETPAVGLFAGFNASPVAGAPPLVVNFSDTSYSSDPGGVLTWAWDFENDGIDDLFVQNPSWTYPCPGTYSVKLTVTDASNPPSILVKSSYINVSNWVFSMTTTGVGDLTVNPIPTVCGQAAGATQGWTLISLDTSLPAGAGPAFGLVPDGLTWAFLFSPLGPGNIAHFAPTPGLYPDAGPLVFPPGFFGGLIGSSMDAVMIFLGPTGGLLTWSDAVRVTF